MVKVSTGIAAAFFALGFAAQANAADELVHATWGGGGAATTRTAYAEPFTAATKIPVKIAEVPNTAG
ncbi:MAG TPA: hypothetical protein VKZ87_09225, partial [Ferrovibrio sp.]|nr:hypothetical protein [Ferrovibrio sp.]